MGIVKNDMVKLAQPCRVSHDAEGAGPDAAEPRARIVEQNTAQAIVEITCGCGSTFYLNCLCASPHETQRSAPTRIENTEETSL